MYFFLLQNCIFKTEVNLTYLKLCLFFGGRFSIRKIIWTLLSMVCVFHLCAIIITIRKWFSTMYHILPTVPLFWWQRFSLSRVPCVPTLPVESRVVLGHLKTTCSQTNLGGKGKKCLGEHYHLCMEDNDNRFVGIAFTQIKKPWEALQFLHYQLHWRNCNKSLDIKVLIASYIQSHQQFDVKTFITIDNAKTTNSDASCFPESRI